MEIISSVRYSFANTNAYWDGSQVYFGDGDTLARADDVVAHELTHGVTQHTSNLFYYYQSGAINESFSDIWGEAIDQDNGYGSDQPGDTWLIGEDFISGANRSMLDPTMFDHPDKMTSEFYHLGDLEDLNNVPFDNGGIHTNSGVNNKAVYLMVEGGSFNGYAVSGIGWQKVLAIYYEVQTSLLTSGSDYSMLFYAVQQACSNLIGGPEGVTPADCLEVTKALNAVEMNLQPVTNFNPGAEICPSGQLVVDQFYDGFESGLNQWLLSSTNSSAWDLASGYTFSGAKMLEMQDLGGVAEVRAEFAEYVNIPDFGQPYLHFNHSFRFNFSYDPEYVRSYMDGGILQYQIIGGPWQNAGDLFDSGVDYNGTVSAKSDSTLASQAAFVADSHGYSPHGMISHPLLENR